MKVVTVRRTLSGWWYTVDTGSMVVQGGPVDRRRALGEAWGWAEPGDRVEILPLPRLEVHP